MPGQTDSLLKQRNVHVHPAHPSKANVPLAAAGRYAACKRAFDFTVALTLLVLSAPITLLAMALVRLTSRGPGIYSQKRLGLNGRVYTIYKVRTMAHDCESKSGAQWCKPADPRVTPVGRLLRRSHLDELPQLWNILRGDMSLVGPRPERPEFVPALEKAIPRYRQRLAVRPGLTGLAQIQLPPDTDLNSVRRKLTCDLHYIERASFGLDLRILVGTVFYVLRVPFGFTRAVLRVPGLESIETASRDEGVPQRAAPYLAEPLLQDA
jgi:lipopolysaccharide/colanic/teichoic acid biosynthesis glycosyltransferase